MNYLASLKSRIQSACCEYVKAAGHVGDEDEIALRMMREACKEYDYQRSNELLAEACNAAEVNHRPVPCRVSRPKDQRVLGWCADEKVWKFGVFMESSGVQWFKHEGQGPIHGEHEVSHWMPMPDAPR